jgi:hypothetical protein
VKEELKSHSQRDRCLSVALIAMTGWSLVAEFIFTKEKLSSLNIKTFGRAQ